MADIKLNIKANTSGLKSQLDGLFKGAFSDISGVAKGGGGFGIGKMLGRGSVVVGALMGIKSVMSRVLGKLTESSAILQANLMIAKQAVRIALKPFGDLLGTLLRPFLMWGLKVAIAINQLLGGEEGQDFLKDKLISTGAGAIGAGPLADIGLLFSNLFDDMGEGKEKANFPSLSKLFTIDIPNVFSDMKTAIAESPFVEFFTVTIPNWFITLFNGIKNIIQDSWIWKKITGGASTGDVSKIQTAEEKRTEATVAQMGQTSRWDHQYGKPAWNPGAVSVNITSNVKNLNYECSYTNGG